MITVKWIASTSLASAIKLDRLRSYDSPQRLMEIDEEQASRGARSLVDPAFTTDKLTTD